MSNATITVKMGLDGVVRRQRADGTVEVLAPPAPEPWDEAAILAAALADPDAQPLTPETMGKMRLAPRARALRRTLGLTQEEFAARYLIPLGTLRDWEQCRTEPDAPARAYLRAIAGDPQAVQRALTAQPNPALPAG